MPFSPQTPLRGDARGNAATLATWAESRGCERPDEVRRYLDTVYQLAPGLDLNPDVMVAQSILETSDPTTGAPWASHWWQVRCNPAGIGITGDPVQNELSRDFGTGEAAARAHLLHLHLYVNGDKVPPGFLSSEDPRWDAAIGAGFAGVVTTLNDLVNTWAIDEKYAEKIAKRLDTLERAELLRELGREPAGPGTALVAAKPYVLLVAGHRSFGDGGDDVERQLTDDLAKAYQKTFKAAGYEVDWFQEVDQDTDPTMTKGGLNGVAVGCGRVLRDRPDDLSLMLDLHFNTRRSAVHAIVPHNRQQQGGEPLNTDYVQGRVPGDIAANNPLDVKMAAAIAKEIASIPGMTLKRAGKSGIAGVMLENETRVGEPPSNSRLAMMATTAPFRFKAVRITIEHGGTDDASKPDFFNRCAQAALRAVNATLRDRIEAGDAGIPADENGHHEEEGASKPALPAFLFGAVGEVQFNPDGPVSQLWLKTGQETGKYPRLADVLVDGDVKFFVFSDGAVIKADGDKPVEFVTDATV